VQLDFRMIQHGAARPLPRKGQEQGLLGAADRSFWTRPLPQLIADLKSDRSGLSSQVATARLLSVGPNALEERLRFSQLRSVARRFANPLVLILIAASAISAATGDLVSSGIIILMVLLGIILDTIQEERANAAAARLRRSVELIETVVRDGKPANLPAREIVPGDVVLLSAGDLVPADGRLLESDDFFVNEASLTGEPFPVEKHAGEAQAGDHSGATNALFMGTSVVGGSAKFLVCATGGKTELGRIAGALRRAPPLAALERGTFRFGLLIARLTVLLALCALLFNLLRHHPLLESFLFAIALAVGLTPELLPMIVSVTLARGAMRLGQKRVIVKRLAAVHDLGAMDILCTDKTGTLTEARIELVRHVDLSGKESERAYSLAALNSRFEAGLKSPLDEAILKHSAEITNCWRKLDEVPFDFERRRVSVLLEGEGHRLLVVKGAPEDVLRLCTRYETAGGTVAELDPQALDGARSQYEALAAEGFRLLAIASRKMAPTVDRVSLGDETELVLAGFTAFLDPPKQSASTAIADLERSGVAVKILTGDNELVTRHVCMSLGLTVSGMLLGSDIDRMGDEALMARAGTTDIFCRVTPVQKNRIILALKHRGHTVGFLGDGINDAPALHSADVGVSVDSAVDVAKDAADLILLDQDLEVVVDGVREGRRTFGNIMKYVMMATSSNFGNMFSMAGAALILPFLPMLPIQVLLKQPALRYFGSRDSARPGRPGRPGAPAALGYRFRPQFHARIGACQLHLRFPHLRAAFAPFPCRCRPVPHRLVHRIAGDSDARHLRHPNARKPAQEPPASCSCGIVGGNDRPGAGLNLFAAWKPARFRKPARNIHGSAGPSHRGLSVPRGGREAAVLPPPRQALRTPGHQRRRH